MSNRNKAKGTSFETVILKYVRPYFSKAYRPATKGKYDTGDINGISNPDKNAIIQCKNVKAFKLSEWLNDTVAQSEQDEVAPPSPGGRSPYSRPALRILRALLLSGLPPALLSVACPTF